MTEIRTIATGLRFPEGPVAMLDGSVVLVEIERQTVTRVKPDGSTEVIAHTGGGPNGLAGGPDGAFYVCNNGGFMWRLELNLMRPAGPASDYTGGCIQRVDPKTGAVTVLYDHCGAHKLLGPNDIVFDHLGVSILPTSARRGPATATGAASITRSPTARRSPRWRIRS
jgi:gluconolactonase